MIEGIKLLLIANRNGISYFMYAFDPTLEKINPDMLTGFINALFTFAQDTIGLDIQSVNFHKISVKFQIADPIMLILIVSQTTKEDLIVDIIQRLKDVFLQRYSEEIKKTNLDHRIFEKFRSDVDQIFHSDKYTLQTHGNIALYKPEAEFVGLEAKFGGRSFRAIQNLILEENGYVIDNGHVIKLGLFKRDMLTLPDEIGNLGNLELLVLSRNKISVLPEQICNLKKLKKFYLDNNQIVKLPDNIGNLALLDEMRAGWNRINTLPESFNQLVKIKQLSFGWNKFTEFPLVIRPLKQLKTLDFSNNRIPEIPEWINDYSELEALNFEGNILTKLPSSIDQLRSLRILNLKSNRLSLLPDQIGTLTLLEHLSLDGNLLRGLPLNITQLKNLKTLNLDHNPWTMLHESVKEWVLDLEKKGCKVYRESLERF